ncbi:protein ALTERED XYLOGLUCAN 4-like [Pistacia vera]|uniref:protein ALTERED XYLOGLUCAN 4-like n=1 Tax=Pistacia vera TaxID=55513 RepID=UPI00126367BD|nr:protein ALTERED XYLOGLUCAN 4-like [Pistacia vera]
MKSSSSLYQQDKLHHYSKNERCISKGRLAPFLFSSLALTTIFSFFLLNSPNPLKILHKQDPDQSLRFIKSQKEDKCDLFKGRWVPELEGGPQYTNSTCATIPISKNCFRHGRRDRDFLNWRWKPEKCDLPKFNAKIFLGILRGKKLAFIGDSVARNHMESLLCLLSQEETPIDAYKDSEDRNRIWYFPEHDFTLKMVWSIFLVVGKERIVNGSSSGVFDLHLDNVEEKWTRELPILDYAIISTAHWFFRPIYLHEAANVIGCVYCSEPNVTKYDVVDALGMAFKATFKYINNCERCSRKLVTLLRTFSPSHFENGTWNTGGNCNRTSPYDERDIESEANEWKLRNIQVEEIERARKEGKKHGKKFEILDVTRAMLMRPDGHPGAFWGNKWMKGYNDCVHWCLPGPIDVWSDFLMAILAKEVGLNFLS